MKHYFLQISFCILCFLIFSKFTNAQNETSNNSNSEVKKENRTKLNFYGFVRNDFTFDSRQNLAAVGELFYFMPLDRNINALGEDLNAIPNSRFLAITSRVGVDIATSFDNLDISAKLEADFCGAAPNIVTLRIRHAYVNFLWNKKHKLLIGQGWHPMVEGTIPSIVSLNTGAPFNPFSRAPQLRYDYISNNFEFTASATYQLQYASPGPTGISTTYQVFGGLPELNLGVKYKYKGFQASLQGNYLGIKPRTTALNTDSIQVKVDDFSHSISASFFLAYSKDLFSIKARTIIGQNLGHILMISGYGVSNTLDNGTWEYSSLNQSSSWINITYGEKYVAGIFGGYIKNLGATKDFISTDKIYVRGFNNVDQIFRVAPSFRWNWKNLCLGAEYEFTGVMYGDKVNPNGSVTDTHMVGNHRLYAHVIYSFRTK